MGAGRDIIHPNDSATAVQAHEQRQRVACAGDLIKERGGYRLQNPRHFRVLEGDDAI